MHGSGGVRMHMCIVFTLDAGGWWHSTRQQHKQTRAARADTRRQHTHLPYSVSGADQADTPAAACPSSAEPSGRCSSAPMSSRARLLPPLLAAPPAGQGVHEAERPAGPASNMPSSSASPPAAPSAAAPSAPAADASGA
jgi:hypothetical protein